MMKTLIRNEDDISIYLFEDDEQLLMGDEQIVVGDPVDLVIGDRHAGNTTLQENVTPPADWAPWKYKLQDGNWISN